MISREKTKKKAGIFEKEWKKCGNFRERVRKKRAKVGQVIFGMSFECIKKVLELDDVLKDLFLFCVSRCSKRSFFITRFDDILEQQQELEVILRRRQHLPQW